MTRIAYFSRTLITFALTLIPLAAVQAAADLPRAPRHDWADRYLARLDTDNKGYIALGDAERYAAAQFDRLDINHDGIVDRDEYLAPLKRSLDTAAPKNKDRVQAAYDRRDMLFHAMDQHGDGKLTKDEYLAGMRQRFADLDAKKDGRITADELRAAHHGV